MFAPQLAKKHAKIRSRINRKIAMLSAISYYWIILYTTIRVYAHIIS